MKYTIQTSHKFTMPKTLEEQQSPRRHSNKYSPPLTKPVESKLYKQLSEINIIGNLERRIQC